MSKSNTNNHSSWQRDERVIAYLSPWRARYASIAKTRAGQLLILCTQQSQDQEQAGAGDLQLLRRWEDGRWWHPPVSIYNGDGFVPHANGTLTTLRSGQLIAPLEPITSHRIPKDDAR